MLIEKPLTVLDSEDGMRKDKSSDDGNFEYGPGIVMKLRSKYQSLALRQNMGRPTLRRSASLENCLDQACDALIGGTPSPTPRCYADEEDEVDGRTRRSGYVNQSSGTITAKTQRTNNSSNGIITRGRSGYSDNRDRMRRARSVDALHSRSARESEEKEILEKFKHVVLPKEEIVIIEVSKPRGSNFGNGFFTQDIEERLSRSVHNGSGTELNRVRSLTSPEHELPPPDIVRETARIFEKNQDVSQTNGNQSSPNNYINNNLNNQVVNGLKKVGHALRLSKTSSSGTNSGGGSGHSSPLPSPTGTSGVVHSSATSGGSSLNGQGGSPYQVQNKGHLSAQGLNASTTTNSSNSSSSNTQLNASVKGNNTNSSSKSSDARNNSIPSVVHSTSTSVNSKSSVASNHNNYSGTSNLSAKQVGVIRPTVTTQNSGSGAVPTGPVINGHISKRNNPTNKSTPSPATSLSATTVKSCIEDEANMNGGSISSSTAKKPPLGPKPLLTSNNIFLKNDKTGSSSPTNMTESSTTTGTNAKSPEPDSDRVRSPTNTTTSNNVDHGILTGGKPLFPLNKTMEIPLEKDTHEPVMEFQQITLKPVAKPKDHSEIILSATSASKNFTSNTNNKTTESNKTDKKDPKVNNNSINNATTKITATVPKKQNVQQQQPPASVPLRKTPSPPNLPARQEALPDDKIPVKQQQQPSQLRAHQQQKLEKQKNGGGGEIMVFNFTNRQKVPDYIEDDGLHRVKVVKISGTVTDESHDDTDGETVETYDHLDAKAYQFEGANIIINGRSSIQKKPKSQKLNISFNEDHTTFEYPSEASVLGEDETDHNKENPLGHHTPNILNSGSGLGNYTPSKIGNSYQLGNYTDRSNLISAKRQEKEDVTNELIEDYLKPDSGSTTWSSEMGADILF